MSLYTYNEGSDNKESAKAGLFCQYKTSIEHGVCSANVVRKLASSPSVPKKGNKKLHQILGQGWVPGSRVRACVRKHFDQKNGRR